MRFILPLLVCLFISGCDSTFDQLPYEPYNDKILIHNYTDKYGLAMGLSTKIYVVYGEYPTNAHKIPAGVILTLDGNFKRFSILQLLVKNPKLATDRAIKEAGIQQYIFKNKLPAYYSPDEMGMIELPIKGRRTK